MARTNTTEQTPKNNERKIESWLDKQKLSTREKLLGTAAGLAAGSLVLLLNNTPEKAPEPQVKDKKQPRTEQVDEKKTAPAPAPVKEDPIKRDTVHLEKLSPVKVKKLAVDLPRPQLKPIKLSDKGKLLAMAQNTQAEKLTLKTKNGETRTRAVDTDNAVRTRAVEKGDSLKKINPRGLKPIATEMLAEAEPIEEKLENRPDVDKAKFRMRDRKRRMVMAAKIKNENEKYKERYVYNKRTGESKLVIREDNRRQVIKGANVEFDPANKAVLLKSLVRGAEK